MFKHKNAYFSAVSVVALLAAAPAMAQTGTGEGVELTGSEIIVTATKRELRLVDVPLSISAISGADMERRNLTQLADFASQIPGFAIQATGNGGTRLVLRGQNAGGSGASVATMVDDVVVSSASSLFNGALLTADLLAFDLDRVEVLRGPQGTLYGATAQGGLLHYITNKPQLGVFEARGQAGFDSVRHGETGWIAQGAVNVPIGEIAALRVTGTYQDVAGYIDNPVRGETDVNGGEQYSVRGQLLLEPTENLSVRLTASLQRSEAGGSGSVELVGGLNAQPSVASKVANGGEPILNTYAPESSLRRFQYYNGVINYDFGAVSLFSSTSYSKYKSFYRSDISNLLLAPGVTAAMAFSPVYGEPIAVWGRQEDSFKKFNEEIRLASNQDVDAGFMQFNWQIGAFYTNEDITFDQYYDAVRESDESVILDVPLPFGGSSLPARYKEYAGFGEATLKFGESFEVSVGGRYSRNKQRSQVTSDAGLIGSGGPDPIVNPEIRTTENKFTYSIAPRILLNRDISVYARLATGYRPGGPVLIVPGAPADFPTFYNSDNTTNYELGIKGSTADRVFTFDVAIYRINWTDVQLITDFVSETNGQVFGVQGNGGSARSEGLEYTLSVNPVKPLTFSVSGGYTHSRLTQDAPAFGGLAGQRLPYVPEFQNAVSIDYVHDLGEASTLSAGVTWTYVGQRYSDFSTAPATTNHARIPDYNTIDLRLGARFGQISVEAFARNLADSQGLSSYSSGGSLGFLGRGTIVQPRTLGMRLGFKY
ncbi:TonB-dependent receptor [Sphingosinicella soli]|uniref:Outer membrane receptor protein involved in Fe transport n=1 Tax=Sphingosinicella soli TaxID=333708 RepID=A0A7W7B5M9_9SPHN|nr:TonB-dependent receptor plug domain-containing protein [Sphingosinicella soli]MBB4633603.1 outer membrane receptor protein involved in Fe transport [Sphingosinicella soli]